MIPGDPAAGIGLLFSPAPMAAFGAIVGSFLNVLASRLPERESLARPGSRCPLCRSPIRLRDNIPIVSFLLLRGRCRDCSRRIPIRYPAVEIAAAVVFLVAPLRFEPAAAAAWLVFAVSMIVLFATDIERLVLPDAITLPTAAAGLLLAGFRDDLSLPEAVVGAALGAGLLGGLRLVWRRWRGVEALGLGDVKMALPLGAFLGPTAVLHAILLASALGLLVALPLLGAGRMDRDTPIPFGAFLAASGVLRFLASASG